MSAYAEAQFAAKERFELEQLMKQYGVTYADNVSEYPLEWYEHTFLFPEDIPQEVKQLILKRNAEITHEEHMAAYGIRDDCRREDYEDRDYDNYSYDDYDDRDDYDD